MFLVLKRGVILKSASEELLILELWWKLNCLFVVILGEIFYWKHFQLKCLSLTPVLLIFTKFTSLMARPQALLVTECSAEQTWRQLLEERKVTLWARGARSLYPGTWWERREPRWLWESGCSLRITWLRGPEIYAETFLQSQHNQTLITGKK